MQGIRRSTPSRVSHDSRIQQPLQPHIVQLQVAIVSKTHPPGSEQASDRLLPLGAYVGQQLRPPQQAIKQENKLQCPIASIHGTGCGLVT